MSIWDSAACHKLVEAAREDAAAAQLMIDVWGKLRSGFYNRDLVDVIFQRYDGDTRIEDAYCFLRIWNEIGAGLIHVQSFDIGAHPLCDAARKENHAALQRLRKFIELQTGLPLKLKVEFFGGSGDQDGYVELGSALTFQRSACEDGCCPAMRCVAPKKKWFALEVGTTTAARTLGHLRQEHGLVRWPYGSTNVTFLYVPTIYDTSTRCHPYDAFGALSSLVEQKAVEEIPLGGRANRRRGARKGGVPK
jgi:hypothetical protein